MRSIFRPARHGVVAPMRMIWLPGAFHAPEDFVTEGFDREVQRRGLHIDLQFVEVELAHVGDRTAIERLESDVVAPARERGCRSVWLCGISLGGYFALDYAATHADGWDGLCLLAPYLGSRPLIAEIAGAPGVAAWQPGPLAQSEEERRIWRFIQAQPAAPRPVYLGYGRDDRFASAHELMAQVLPPQAVQVAAGAHDWPTWLSLWGRFLDSVDIYAS